MESLIVYQKIPHPGIQVNLNSYYSQQVGAVSSESSGRAGTQWVVGQVGETACLRGSTPPSCVTEDVSFQRLHLCICEIGIDHLSKVCIWIKGDHLLKAL